MRKNGMYPKKILCRSSKDNSSYEVRFALTVESSPVLFSILLLLYETAIKTLTILGVFSC